jgi:diacylglycerol kinase (ATP)
MRHQPNMRFHILAGTGAVVAGVALGLPIAQWSAVTFAVVLVLLGETVNSAIEALLDIIHPDHHPLVKVAKDLAAGAVLIAAIGALVIALLVFVPAVLRAIH